MNSDDTKSEDDEEDELSDYDMDDAEPGNGKRQCSYS